VSAPEAKPLIALPMAMRWRDLDAFNHANNSTYLTYLEEARLQWMTQVDGWMNERHAPILAAVHVNYRRPLNWPADIIVELYCERIGNTSLTLAHRIVDASDLSALYSDGQSVMVWIDQDGKPVALPEAVRSACQ
jgi:acyl-CoA thioester hydrolase